MFKSVISFSFLACLLPLSAFAHPQHDDTIQARSPTTPSASSLLTQGINALGGQKALQSLKTYQIAAYLFRSHTLEESVVPGFADNAIATTGKETLTYDLTASDIVQRVDREYSLDWIWQFARPLLEPTDASIVVHGGSKGYACYNKGNELIYLPATLPYGYTDASYTRILVRDAWRLSPTLLLTMLGHSKNLSSGVTSFQGVQFPAVTDSTLGLTVLFNSSTSLPYVIRAYEDHAILGRSTNDIALYNYTTASTVKVPRRIAYFYNNDSLLVDALFGNPTINPTLAAGYFDGLPLSEVNNTGSMRQPAPAALSKVYGDAEVFENTQNLLWNGGYTGTLANLKVDKPMPDLPNLYHLVFTDAPQYTVLVADFGDAVMVTDALAHQSKLVIQWIKTTLKKAPTHLLMTHHHHDHAYGAIDFVNAGAKIVCPEEYTYFWSEIPGVQFATSTEDKPFAYKNNEMQVRAIWHVKAPHANDFMYFTWTVACPGPNDRMAITEADAWSPGESGFEYGHIEATQLVALWRSDHAPRDSLTIPIHGEPTNSTILYEQTGSAYPDYKTTDFLPGGPWC